ncbi:hypothetical protein KY290_000755 [Solanum tuberosum]|uniref:Uncharacterized protein n=1 Tax=Solanum tuberosum TaxID=4113 RepID=A0ABQ7WMG2_SOLTU|nr:hypothetical protein KY289_000818 [Solanum tuberosum]KAH0781157.1 hypothetical protein KY290_000755 [Solanum tuberosum]
MIIEKGSEPGRICIDPSSTNFLISPEFCFARCCWSWEFRRSSLGEEVQQRLAAAALFVGCYSSLFVAGGDEREATRRGGEETRRGRERLSDSLWERGRRKGDASMERTGERMDILLGF